MQAFDDYANEVRIKRKELINSINKERTNKSLV